MTETTAKTTKSAPGDAEEASESFAKGQETFEASMRAGSEALSGAYEKWFRGWDVLAESNANFDAALESGRISAKGFEKIAGKMAAYAAASMADGVAASKAVLACKDLRELTEVQSAQFRKFLDAWLAEGRELSELTVRTATRAAEPIGKRINAAIDKALKPAA